MQHMREVALQVGDTNLWDELLTYEAEIVKRGMDSIALQPHVADHAYIPHMKAMHVPFNWLYGSLICNHRLQSDRPKY